MKAWQFLLVGLAGAGLALGPGVGAPWQQIHAVVDSAAGTQPVMTADEGRTLVVSLPAGTMAAGLSRGAGVTIVGYYLDPQRVIARMVQPDSASPSALPR